MSAMPPAAIPGKGKGKGTSSKPCDDCSKKKKEAGRDMEMSGPAPGVRQVTLITPTLQMGGAEQWIRTLVLNADPKRISYVVVLLNPQEYHSAIVDDVTSCATVVACGPCSHPEVISARSQREGFRMGLRDASAVVVWGGGQYYPLPTTAPVVFVAHGSCEYTRAATKQARAGGVSHFVAVSQASVEAIKDLCPAPPHMIWNGGNEERLTRTVEDLDAVRKSWSGHRDWTHKTWKYVAYMGRLSAEKNADAVVEAIAQLPSRYRCVIIGDSGTSAGSLVPWAKTRLGQRLLACPTVDNIGDQLAAVDVVVQVSPREGNSLTIIEAMLAGVPIVTTPVGAVPEFTKAARSELFLTVPEDPLAVEVAEAIREVVQQGRDSSRTQRAREFALAHLTGAKMGAEWTEYLLTKVMQQ